MLDLEGSFGFKKLRQSDEDTHISRIPLVPIYKYKNSFYKELDVDKNTMQVIRLYNKVKQEVGS